MGRDREGTILPVLFSWRAESGEQRRITTTIRAYVYTAPSPHPVHLRRVSLLESNAGAGAGAGPAIAMAAFRPNEVVRVGR